MALTLYKASAGTGKTYKLTLHYLLLLMGTKDYFDPMAFSHILAVTFTNKATEEMKSRILESLEKLMSGHIEDSVWKDIKKETLLDDNQIRQRAEKIHAYILHHYSHFAVSTMDAFFQKVLQSFVVEAGLSLEYSLDLDTPLLLEKTAVEVMNKAAQDKQLRRRLAMLLQDNVRNADNWDLTRLLIEVGKEITKESFRSYGHSFVEQLSDEVFMRDFTHQLKEIEKTFEGQMSQFGERAVEVFNREGLVSSMFPQKGRSFVAYLQHIITPSTNISIYTPNSYTRSAAAGEAKMWKGVEQYQPLLQPYVQEAVDYVDAHFKAYCTAMTLRKKLPQMMLVADIYTVMRQLQQQNNTLNIAESTYLLSTLIGEGDAPFIYEKTGSFYSSFLLDEFQDTSYLQWRNIRPLLYEGLSKGADSLVVGDVKQSIYRWRNGDWRILGHQILEDDYLTQYGIKTETLSVNYRSRNTIIDFVNRLTGRMIDQIVSQDASSPIPKAYSPYEEKCPVKPIPQEEGFVQATCIESTPSSDSTEQTLASLQQLLSSLQKRGYRPQDILILVRQLVEGQSIMNYLMQYMREHPEDTTCYNLVSSDSLSLSASPHVRLAVAVMQRSLYPMDDSIREIVHYMEQMYGPKERPVVDDTAFLAQLKTTPPVAAFELLMQRMEWTDRVEALPYLQELHDLLLNFCKTDSSGLYGFCKYWEQKGASLKLTSEVSVNAIRVFTIHKAKGLQAPVVIVPFCDWKMQGGTDVIWAHTSQKPFDVLECMPVPLVKQLESTYFAEEYQEESRQKQMDALNMLYVAVTRPKDELYLFFKKGKEIGQILGSALIEMTDNSEGSWSFGKELSTYAITTMHNRERQQKEAAVTHTYALDSYPSGNYQKSLCLAYEEEPFVFSADDSMRQWGIVLHKALSTMERKEDLSAVLAQLAKEGEISGNTETLQHFTKAIEEVLSRPEVSSWYDGSWKVRNECSILCAHTSGNTPVQLRPDRVLEKEDRTVVIDYKFGQKLPSHQRQIEGYVETLRLMGYPNVEGHLLYF